MILYRGTNVKIDYIDLEKCKPYRDFGKGFYCTTIKKQAENIFNDKNIKVIQILPILLMVY